MHNSLRRMMTAELSNSPTYTDSGAQIHYLTNLLTQALTALGGPVVSTLPSSQENMSTPIVDPQEGIGHLDPFIIVPADVVAFPTSTRASDQDIDTFYSDIEVAARSLQE